MNWREVKQQWKRELNAQEDPQEIDSWYHLFIEAEFGISRLDYLMRYEEDIPIPRQERLDEALKLLKQDTPIQHITGRAYFMNQCFEVSPDVLIPRPETEDLVLRMIRDIPLSAHVIDLGTGSGCIPISLKLNRPDLKISGLDISAKALEVAKRNAIELEADVEWIHGAIKEKMTDLGTFDVMVSNPPYIPNSERSTMKRRVSGHEPDLALFVPDEDPIRYYRWILENALRRPTVNYIYWEIHPPLRPALEKMCRDRGIQSVEVQKDRFDRDRIMILKTV